MTEPSLTGRRILVTGAASGIGAATARRLAALGASLALTDSNDSVAVVAAEIGAWSRTADVRDEAEVTAAVTGAHGALGGLDGLVNCAGVATVKRLEDTSLEDWRSLIDTNMTGVFLFCRAAAPLLRAVGAASIVNLASASGLTPSFAGAAYGASKAGVIMLSKSLARELAPTVRVNAVCPGVVETPMFTAMAGTDEATIAGIKAGYALQRLAQSEEIADAIAFLCGPQSAFITGVALAVDGGRSFH
ncbi:MAG: short-chain alcohol dehydrogenase [Brevundimonas sp.]|nr:short-chain alcohol dehydrogenase [Brevundimonas sp.]